MDKGMDKHVFCDVVVLHDYMPDISWFLCSLSWIA